MAEASERISAATGAGTTASGTGSVVFGFARSAATAASMRAWISSSVGMAAPFSWWVVAACAVGFGVYLLGNVAEQILTVAGPAAAAAFVVLVIGVLYARHRRSSRSG